MINLKWQENYKPAYKTKFSSGADLKSRIEISIASKEVALVPTGVWIDSVEWESMPKGLIPELQIRARSSLAFKHGITLANAVGTIDADYPDEIKVLLWNTSEQNFKVSVGDRIAQIILNYTVRINQLDLGGKRVGGFGSTGLSDATL